MKTFIFNPALLLLSTFGMNNGFFFRSIGKGIERTASHLNFDSFDSIPTFASKRRKELEDLVVDGFIDSTKKLLLNDESSSKKRSIKSYHPRTPNQSKFVELMRDDAVDILIAIGPAGTGKTLLACYAAVEALRLGKVNKVVVTRPVVSVDEEIGFLPGDLESKMDPWTRPIFDVLKETYSTKEINHMTEEGIIEIVPLGFMRGRTFKNTWIIADEMQNSSPTQMFMLATRIGEGSKMIITGDLNQSDRDINDNGLRQIYEKVSRSSVLDCVRYVELEKEDVQRSRAAKRILDIYDISESPAPAPLSLSAPLSSPPSPFPSPPAPLIANSEDTHDKCDEVVTEQSVRTSFVSSVEKDWIDIDNDAALIPLRHMKRSNNR